MSKDFRKIVADVKLAHDIVDYIENSGVTLKVAGTKYKGLCPFHNEKTPSFTVDPHFLNYRCFGCNANGDIIKFVQETNGLEFMDALRLLAEEKGIELPEFSGDNENGESHEDRATMREIIRQTGLFFWGHYRNLDDNHVAKQEVAKRGMTIDNVYNIYGYAPEGKNSLYTFLRDKGFSEESILATGVCNKLESGDILDFWRGRLMFIMKDITGKPVGFSGRRLHESDRRGKYVNSSDSSIFHKSSLLFNADIAKTSAREKEEVYVVEGQFDVMALLAAGLENVVASSGTAFTEKQSALLRRLVGTEGRIVFVFDADSAGLEAASKVFDVDKALHSRAYVVQLPPDRDPSDMVQHQGSEALKAHIEDPANTVSLVEFVLKHLKGQYNLETPEGRTNYIDAAAIVLKKIGSRTLQEEYSKLVALDVGAGIDTIKEAVEKADVKAPYTRDSTEEEQIIEQQDERKTLYEETTDEIADKIIDAMKTHQYHQITAKFLWLCFSRYDILTPDLPKLKKTLFNEVYHRIFDELYTIWEINHGRNDGHYPPIVSEMFTDHRVVEEVLTNHRLVYLVRDDDDSVKTLFRNMLKQLSIQRVNRKYADKRAQLTPFLADNTRGSTLEVFERVIGEQEKIRLENQDFVNHVLATQGILNAHQAI